jgi:tetratricopeptide (TPR) repeat protein
LLDVAAVDSDTFLALGAMGEVSVWKPKSGTAVTALRYQGYTFLLKSRWEFHPRTLLPLTAWPGVGFSPGSLPGAITWLSHPPGLGPAQWRAGQLDLQIYRDGVLLRRQSVSAPPGVLRLRATRQGDQLNFQINDQSPLSFFDEFPIRVNERAVFGLLAPSGVCPAHLRVMRQGLLSQPSEAELGNAAYARGEYHNALAHFRQAAARLSRGQSADEIRCKEALCLVKLKQHDKARSLFEEVAQSSGNRWVVVALGQLGLIHLHANRLAEARDTWARLIRLPTENVQEAIPDTVRRGMLAAYAPLLSPPGLIQRDTRHSLELERAVAVANRIDAPAHVRVALKHYLMNAYQFEDRLGQARQQAQELLADGTLHPITRAQVFSELMWILHRDNHLAGALALIPARLDLGLPAEREDLVPLLERARVRARQKQWPLALADLDRFDKLFAALQEPPDQARWYYQSCLLRGFVHEAQDQREQALQSWRRGVDFRRRGALWWSLDASILASLAGELKDEEAVQMVRDVLPNLKSIGDQVIGVALSTKILRPGDFAPLLRRQWSSPVGREKARQMILYQMSYKDYYLTQIKLFVGESIFQWALADLEDTPWKEAFVWPLVEAIYRGYDQREMTLDDMKMLVAGMLPHLEIVLGKGGIPSTASIQLKGQMAFVLGHRNRRLGKKNLARDYFQRCITNPEADAELRTRARQSLELLGTK